jgi:hypothetical protein
MDSFGLMNRLWPNMIRFVAKPSAIILALLALFLLGFGLFPILSPLGFAFSLGDDYYWLALLSFPVSLLVMWLACRISMWAHKLPTEKRGMKR